MSGNEDRDHRAFSPSQAERISLCPGSHSLLKRVPAHLDSEYAIEGRKAHNILETALKNKVRNAVDAHKDYSTLCLEELPDSLYWAVDKALTYIYQILDLNPDAIMYVETFVDTPSEAAPGEAGGWCDVAIYLPSRRWLLVIDYKHGVGVIKDVQGNMQIMQYGAGFLYEADAKVDPNSLDGVTLVVIQPRAFHADGDIREWDITPYQLYEYLAVMDKNIAAALAENAPLVPGDVQCQFCDAKVECPARTALALSAIGTQYRTVLEVTRDKLPNIEMMDMEALSRLFLLGPLLIKWVEQGMLRIEELTRMGYDIPNTKLVEIDPKRKWYGEPAQIAEKLAALIGCKPEDVYPPKLLGITDAEALLVRAWRERAAKGKKNEASYEARKAMSLLTLKEPTGRLTLVGTDDPRPAVLRGSAAFAQIKEQLQLPQQPGEGK